MWTSQYVARSSDAHALYPVFVHRLARLLHASFRPRLTTIALALSLALHLHQVGRRTFTSKLLSMPSTQLKPADRRRLVDQCRNRLKLNGENSLETNSSNSASLMGKVALTILGLLRPDAPTGLDN